MYAYEDEAWSLLVYSCSKHCEIDRRITACGNIIDTTCSGLDVAYNNSDSPICPDFIIAETTLYFCLVL